MIRLILLLILFQRGDFCQPPIPVAYQNSAAPMQFPSQLGAQYSPSRSIVAGLDQSAPAVAPPPPPPPPPPVAMSASSSEALEMIDAPTSSRQTMGITPYPGYIPPPPPQASSDFPTLIESIDYSDLENRISQQSSNTYLSEVPLQFLGDEKNSSTCPPELTTLLDFLSCVQRLSTVTLDEHILNCDFEKDSGCRFKSVSSPLSVGRFRSADHYRTFATLASRPQHLRPTGNFAFFIEHRGANVDDEFVLSTPIMCQKGNGILKFDYWIIGKQDEVLLKVCTQNYLARSCTQTISYNKSASKIAIEVVHPNTTFFELEIVASNILEPTVIVYDNIQYTSEMCESNEKTENELEDEEAEVANTASVDTFFEEEEKETATNDVNSDEQNNEKPKAEIVEDVEPLTIPTRPIRLSPIKQDVGVASEITETTLDGEEAQNICQLLNCDFSTDLCSFTNYKNDSMPLSDWNLESEKVGNPHTGVREGSGFIYVGTDNPSSKIVNYILESPDLSTNADFYLSIDIYRRSNDITLQICLDTPFYCPYSLSNFKKDDYWIRGERFMIPEGTLKIYFKAIQWRKFKWLAIDNVKVISDKC